MAHRLPSSMRRLDRILKNGLFTGNLNILTQVQPKCLGLRQFRSQSKLDLSSKPPKGSDKHNFQPKKCNKSAPIRIGEQSEADPKSSGGGDGTSGEPGLGGKNKTGILVAIGTAGILGVCWWAYYFKKTYNNDFNWKGFLDNLLGRTTVENRKEDTDMKTNGYAALYDCVPFVVLYCGYVYLDHRGHRTGPKPLILAKFLAFTCITWAAFIALDYVAGEYKIKPRK